jgi:hypothetical protein
VVPRLGAVAGGGGAPGLPRLGTVGGCAGVRIPTLGTVAGGGGAPGLPRLGTVTGGGGVTPDGRLFAWASTIAITTGQSRRMRERGSNRDASEPSRPVFSLAGRSPGHVNIAI